jgi:hypothetical protein
MNIIDEDFEEVKDEDGRVVGYALANRNHFGKFAKVPMELFYEGRYLSLKAKWVYATLVSFKNGKTGRTFPSYNAIMKRSGINRRQDIADALEELEHFNWITKTRHFSKANDYFVGGCPVTNLHDGTKFRPLRPTKSEADIWKSRNRKRSTQFNEFILDRTSKVTEQEDEWAEEIPF